MLDIAINLYEEEAEFLGIEKDASSPLTFVHFIIVDRPSLIGLFTTMEWPAREFENGVGIDLTTGKQVWLREWNV